MSSTPQESRILVVGGHARNIGKTALIVDLIRAFPEARWLAVKITPHEHDAGRSEGPVETMDEPAYALVEETEYAGRTDTSRFLAAGANRACLLRIGVGKLAEGISALRAHFPEARNVIIESNAVARLLRPELFLVVLDPWVLDFKTSAGELLPMADAVVLRDLLGEVPWPGISPHQLNQKPRFLQLIGEPLPEPLRAFVRVKFFAG